MYGMRRDEQAEAYLIAALTTLRELLPRKTRHLVIVMVAAMANLVDP